MRTAFLLALCLIGCSSSSGPTKTPVRGNEVYARHALQSHYTWARSLQHLVMQRRSEELLDESGQALILQLAKAQNCLASRVRNSGLPHETKSMLDAYIELHDGHGLEPSRALRRKINRAHLDAEVVAQGVASPYFLGCEPFRTPRRRHAAHARRRAARQRAIRNANTMQASGVIRNPRTR